MANENTNAQATPTSYDLISINGYALPDVKLEKGDIVVAPLPKYNEHEGEEGNKIIDVISTDKIRGSVTFNGLFQSQIQTIMAHLDLVSVLEIYTPATGAKKRFSALILVGDMQRIIHDSNANAWSFSFEFEEIDDAPQETQT